jgi:hypothetical protein
MYVGGLNVGAFAGYGIAREIRGEAQPTFANPFVGEGSAIPLLAIFGSAILGPFLLHAIIQKWRFTTYPVLILCALLVLADIGYVVKVLAGL